VRIICFDVCFLLHGNGSGETIEAMDIVRLDGRDTGNRWDIRGCIYEGRMSGEK